MCAFEAKATHTNPQLQLNTRVFKPLIRSIAWSAILIRVKIHSRGVDPSFPARDSNALGTEIYWLRKLWEEVT